MGLSTIKKLKAEHEIEEGSPEAFKKFFVDKYLKEASSEPGINGSE